MSRISLFVAILVAVIYLMFSPPVMAQAAMPVETGAPQLKYFDFFVVKGGPIALGLILLSMVMVALIVEHGLTIRRRTLVPPDTARRVQKMIEDKQYLEAIQFTAEEPSLMSYALNCSLLEASNGFHAMERALYDSLEERAARLFRKIEYLNIIGNVAPMIGLFGTVVGMILLFAEIHASDAFPAARDVADKVAVALITTFWGLAVAIPALSAHAIFRNRIDVLVAECTLTSERILSIFKPDNETSSESSKGKSAESTAVKGKES